MNTQTDKSARTDLALALGAAALAAAACLLSGCVRYSHTAVTGDKTTFTAFCVKAEASKVTSDTTTQGTNYTRKVSLGSVKGESDVDKLSAMAEAMARGVATGVNPAKLP